MMLTSLLGKDTTLTKIFVGGLPYHTTDETLRQFFEHFGDIEEAVVITDRQTSKSRGYGFVTMSDAEAAARACKDPNPVIDGRKANVNLAYLGAKPRSNVATAAASQLPLALKTTAYPGILGSGSQLGSLSQQYMYSALAAQSTYSNMYALQPATSPALVDPSLYSQQLVAAHSGLENASSLSLANAVAQSANPLLAPQYYVPTTQLTGAAATPSYTVQQTHVTDRLH